MSIFLCDVLACADRGLALGQSSNQQPYKIHDFKLSWQLFLRRLCMLVWSLLPSSGVYVMSAVFAFYICTFVRHMGNKG